MTTSAARALLTATWRERWNRSWRFSPAKSGLWLLLLQAALAGVALWRPSGSRAALPFGTLLLTMGAQAGLWSFLAAFLTGRSQLYSHKCLPLIHTSPAESWSLPEALVGAHLPQRAWSMLLWTATLALLLPVPDRWWGAPALWAAGLLAGTMAHLAGLLALIAWVRFFPHALGATWGIVVALQLGLVYGLLYLAAGGMAPAQLATLLERLRWWLGLGLAGLFGIPGALALLWLGRRPGRLGDLYRESWLRLAAREWITALRNPFTHFRAGVTLMLLLALIPARPYIAGLATRTDVLVIGVGVGLIFFTFGEMAGAFFSSEGGRMALYVITGTHPARLLGGKLFAASPLALLCGAATWFTGLAAGTAPGAAALLALRSTLIGLGMVSLMVGTSALDAAIQEPEDDDRGDEGLSAALGQVPRGPFSAAGMLAGGLCAAAAVWWPGLAGALSLLPVAALLAGVWWLHRLLHSG